MSASILMILGSEFPASQAPRGLSPNRISVYAIARNWGAKALSNGQLTKTDSEYARGSGGDSKEPQPFFLSRFSCSIAFKRARPFFTARSMMAGSVLGKKRQFRQRKWLWAAHCAFFMLSLAQAAPTATHTNAGSTPYSQMKSNDGPILFVFISSAKCKHWERETIGIYRAAL